MLRIQERLQLLEAAQAMRLRHKPQRIAEMLEMASAGDADRRLTVEARYGETRYAAWVITNPFLHPRMLQVASSDTVAVSVVSEEAELSCARRSAWLHASGGGDVRASGGSLRASGGSLSAKEARDDRADADADSFQVAEVATRVGDKTWQLLVAGIYTYTHYIDIYQHTLRMYISSYSLCTCIRTYIHTYVRTYIHTYMLQVAAR